MAHLHRGADVNLQGDIKIVLLVDIIDLLAGTINLLVEAIIIRVVRIRGLLVGAVVALPPEGGNAPTL